MEEVSSSTPHGSGRAEFLHPALRVMVWLRKAKRSELELAEVKDIWLKATRIGPNPYNPERNADQATYAKPF